MIDFPSNVGPVQDALRNGNASCRGYGKILQGLQAVCILYNGDVSQEASEEIIVNEGGRQVASHYILPRTGQDKRHGFRVEENFLNKKGESRLFASRERLEKASRFSLGIRRSGMTKGRQGLPKTENLYSRS